MIKKTVPCLNIQKHINGIIQYQVKINSQKPSKQYKLQSFIFVNIFFSLFQYVYLKTYIIITQAYISYYFETLYSLSFIKLLKIIFMDKVKNIDLRTYYQNYADIFVKGTHISRERHGIFIPAVISQIPQDAEICADLGCGNAYYHNTILQKRPNISKLIGIDFSSPMLQMVPPQIKQNPKTQYILQDLTEPFSLKKQYFDCLVSLFTLEYVSRDKMDTYIKNCYKMLKPNGKLVIICCHVNNFKNDPLLGKIVPYKIITDKEIIQDGGKSYSNLGQTSFRVTFIHWQNQTLINYLKMAGFQGKTEFLREQYIDKTLFNQQEIKTIVDSKGYRLVTGIKKSNY